MASNTRISEEHSREVMSLLICKPWLDDSQVCRAVPDEVVQRYEDLERHVRWRRKVIYTVVRILEDSTVGNLPASEDAQAAAGLEKVVQDHLADRETSLPPQQKIGTRLSRGGTVSQLERRWLRAVGGCRIREAAPDRGRGPQEDCREHGPTFAP